MSETVRLLIVSASPRANGNSAFLASSVLDGLDDVSPIPFAAERYGFAGKKIGPCVGCLACYKNGGRCVIEDDFEALRQLWIAADAVLYVFPVYHAGVPAQLKCFMDRLGNSFYGYYETGPSRHMKAIGSIAQGGVPMGGQEISNLTVMLHATMTHSFFVTGDAGHLGCGLVSGAGGNRNAFRGRAESGDPAFAREIEAIQNMVRRLIETAAILKAGVRALRPSLQQDGHYVPFIERLETKN